MPYSYFFTLLVKITLKNRKVKISWMQMVNGDDYFSWYTEG